ncbi:thioredoxin domain-containing protein [Nesterenkonia halotolerans]|uniref:thioredoxin domain-containing protein n=1 Tax=Nesterenkonia halotolerans TaxID=225325 RepID=UPI00362866B4
MGHRLADSSSLYLRSHADNPVDWFPWGAEAFAEARRRDVPVFVSIGYAACHWCHVMARESFEDAALAAALNERFVAIKVDREEHPDVDDTYMAATQAMTGQGGWPMSVFTLPDGRVFHAGTYFPPRRFGQVPSFAEVLDAVHSAWTQRREEVETSAEQIAASLGAQRRQQAGLATTVHTRQDDDAASSASTGDAAVAPLMDAAEVEELVTQALALLAEQEDTVHGGFGSAPKFPPSPLLGFLLEEAAWDRASPAAGLAIRTLEALSRSALFDQVEGGFARYATDLAWALPHFEKMLYDNAQLLGHSARLSVHPAADAEQRERAARQARMSIDWLTRRMLLEDSGLLASSLDADTVDETGHHAEGATYLFADTELHQVALAAGLNETEVEQLLVLNRGVPADEHGATTGAPLHVTPETPRTLHFDAPLTEAQATLWDRALPELRRRRAERHQPARDEKVVAAWNAQTISSLAVAAALWADEALLDDAQALAQRLWQTHVTLDDDDDGAARVHRISYAGRRGDELGGLSDHAHLAVACFQLSSAGAETDPQTGAQDGAAGPAQDAGDWRDRGAAVLRMMLKTFVREQDGELQLLESADDDGLLAAAQHRPLFATPLDGPEPSSVAALAQALQMAEALELLSAEDLRPEQILQHVKLAAAKAPTVIGASMLVARRSARKSPAFRFLGGTAQDLAEVRRAGALYGVPVEPVDAKLVEPGAALRLSVCLNAVGSMVCLPPVDSLQEVLEGLR